MKFNIKILLIALALSLFSDLQAQDPPPPPGGGHGQGGGQVPGGGAPLGEGIAFLTALSIGYAAKKLKFNKISNPDK